MNLRLIPLLHIKYMKKKHSCIYMNHGDKNGSVCSLFNHKFYRYTRVENGYAGKPYYAYCFDINIVKYYCKNCLSFEPKENINGNAR